MEDPRESRWDAAPPRTGTALKVGPPRGSTATWPVVSRCPSPPSQSAGAQPGSPPERAASDNRCQGGSLRVESFSFGSLWIDGVTNEHDLVIGRDEIRKRKKSASKQYRDASGQTPLSIKADILGHGRRLVAAPGSLHLAGPGFSAAPGADLGPGTVASGHRPLASRRTSPHRPP